MTHNPYAPPKANVLPDHDEDAQYWVEGNLLKVRENATLPRICLLTGGEGAVVPKNKPMRVMGSSPWLLLGIIPAFFWKPWGLYVFILMINIYNLTRKRFRMTHFLSAPMIAATSKMNMLLIGAIVLGSVIGIPLLMSDFLIAGIAVILLPLVVVLPRAFTTKFLYLQSVKDGVGAISRVHPLALEKLATGAVGPS